MKVTLSDFLTSFVAKHQKIEGGSVWGKNFSQKQSLAMPKKIERGTRWSRPVLYVTRETFWISSSGQRVQFGVFLKFCRTFGRTILVTKGVSKKKF